MIRSLRVTMLLLPLVLVAASDAGPRFAVDPERPPAEWVLRESPVRSPEQSMATFDLAPGFRAELVASEPLVEDPIALAFGPDGRIWVAEDPAYNWKYREPLGLPEEPAPSGRIVVLEDTTGDGRMDQRTVFLDDLVGPRALTLVDDGVLVADPPRVWFCRDTTGDGRADQKTQVVDDYGTRANPHAMASGLLRAMDNWIYSAGYGARLRWSNGDWERDAPVVARGQWSMTQDNYGRLRFNRQHDPLRGDAVRPAYWRRNPNLQEPAGLDVRLAHDARAIYPHAETPGVNQREFLGATGMLEHFTSSGGPAVYRGEQFPAELVGDAFVCVPAGNLVRHFALSDDDGVVEARNAYEEREFLFAHDERFRPVHAYTGPDGALYLVDMYRGIIEGEPWLTEMTRDYKLARGLHQPFEGLGRIYRIVHEDQPPGDWPDLAEQGPEQWVGHLPHANGWWRDTAQRLLIEDGSAEAVPALRRLAGDASVEPYARLHALWTLEGLDALDASTAAQALADESFRVRETALRLAEPWLAEADVLAAALALVDDEHGEVRRQLLFTLGETAGDEATTAMRGILHRDGAAPWMAEAALSGLHGRELAFLESLIADADWQDAPAGGERVVRLLARAVTGEGDASRLTRLTGLLQGAGWWGEAVLAGIDEGPASHLARAPEAVRHLLDLPDAALRERATALVASIESDIGDDVGVDVAELDESVRLLYERGRTGYLLCAACHQQDGQGTPDVAPALAGSPWLERPAGGLIRITLHGFTDREEYPPMAPLVGLDDEHLAAILTYLRLTFSEGGGPVQPEDIHAVREQSVDQVAPWTVEALESLD